jgi:hypothetical protein
MAVAACSIRGRAASEYDEVRGLPGIFAGRPGYRYHRGMEKFRAKKIASRRFFSKTCLSALTLKR